MHINQKDRQILLNENNVKETTALKSELMALMADIEDKNLLQAVKTILDYRIKEKFMDLTAKQE